MKVLAFGLISGLGFLRQVSIEELNEATGGFPENARLAETAGGGWYRGMMQVSKSPSRSTGLKAAVVNSR